MALRDTLEDLFDAILPARCPGCGRCGALVCDACAATLVRAPIVPPPPPVAWWTSCFVYTGVARELVARAKYRNERRFLVLVARELAGAIEAVPSATDLITWAPASAARIRAQGVDHGEVLARAVARFTGVRVADLAAAAKVKPSAHHVVFEAAGGYTSNVPLREAIAPNVLIAHRLDGTPLARAHGAPVRAFVPDLYFWKSAKWLTGIRFVSADEPGYWETRGYHNHADPWREERYS